MVPFESPKNSPRLGSQAAGGNPTTQVRTSMPKIPDTDNELIFDGDEENLLEENLLDDLDEGGDD